MDVGRVISNKESGYHMGLTADYTTPGGLTASGAYHRIKDIHIRIDKDDEDNTVVTSNITVDIHKDATARGDGTPAIGGFGTETTLDLAGSKNQYNLVKQSYEYLKTLDEYSSAVDN